jgi:hypothetical protein
LTAKHFKVSGLPCDLRHSLNDRADCLNVASSPAKYPPLIFSFDGNPNQHSLGTWRNLAINPQRFWRI